MLTCGPVQQSAHFEPVSPSFIVATYEASAGADINLLEDPFLVLEDLVAHRWTGCPEDISVTLVFPQSSKNVSWVEPTATDNVAVVSETVSMRPGTSLELVGSPSDVVYVARDAAGLEAVCQFQIEIKNDASVLTVSVPLLEQFETSSYKQGVLSTRFTEYQLISSFEAALSF